MKSFDKKAISFVTMAGMTGGLFGSNAAYALEEDNNTETTGETTESASDNKDDTDILLKAFIGALGCTVGAGGCAILLKAMDGEKLSKEEIEQLKKTNEKLKKIVQKAGMSTEGLNKFQEFIDIANGYTLERFAFLLQKFFGKNVYTTFKISNGQNTVVATAAFIIFVLGVISSFVKWKVGDQNKWDNKFKCIASFITSQFQNIVWSALGPIGNIISGLGISLLNGKPNESSWFNLTKYISLYVCSQDYLCNFKFS